MKIRFSLLAFLITLPALAGTVTPTWTFTDFGLDALTVKKMRVTPLAPYGTNGSGIITGDWRERTTDTNGSVTLTNIANGYSYRVEFSGPWAKTSFTNSFSGSVTGAVNAVDYISSTLVSDSGLVAYSKLQANGLFLTKTNSAMIGTPTVNGTNLVSLVSGGGSSITLSNTTSAVGLTNGMGGIGTNTAHLVGTNLWVSGSNALAGAARSIGGATILRGTSNIPYSTLMEATTNWQAGDTVELWGTNFQTLSMALPLNLTLRSRADAGKTMIIQSNVYLMMTNNLRVQDVTFWNPLTNLDGNFSITNCNLAYAGTNHLTNVVVERCSFLNANANILCTGESDSNTGRLEFDINGCYFENNAIGIRFINAASTSFIRIRNSTFKSEYSLNNNWSTMCALRLNCGTNSLENVAITAKNAPAESIGVYVAGSTVRFKGVSFPDCVVTNGARPPLNVLVQTGGVVVDVDGCLKSSDVTWHSPVEVTTTPNDGSNPADTAPSSKLGINELSIVGSNGITATSLPFVDTMQDSMDFQTRTAWMARLSSFPYASNGFSSFAQVVTNNIIITNANGISYSLFATNSLLITNTGSGNMLTTVATNDIIVVSNLGLTIGSFQPRGGRLNASYAILASSNVAYNVNIPQYVPASSNVVVTNASFTAADPIANSTPAKYFGTNYTLNPIRIERVTSAQTRYVFVSAIEVYSATNVRSSKWVVALDPAPQVSLDTNVYLAQFAGTTAANAAYLWSGTAYTNTTVTGRFITNNGSYWQLFTGGISRYTNNDLANDWIVDGGSSPAPATTYGTRLFYVPGQLTISNLTSTYLTSGSGVFSTLGYNSSYGFQTTNNIYESAGTSTDYARLAGVLATNGSLFATNLTTGTLNVTGNATNNGITNAGVFSQAGSVVFGGAVTNLGRMFGGDITNVTIRILTNNVIEYGTGAANLGFAYNGANQARLTSGSFQSLNPVVVGSASGSGDVAIDRASAGVLKVINGAGSSLLASLLSSNGTFAGVVFSTNGYAMPTNSPTLTGVTNGMSHMWNSNGTVYLRTSRVAATNWADTKLADAP